MKAAVERIKGDPDFARWVYREPEEVLLGKYDLDPAQWQAVHRAFVADVEDTEDDVSGFQLQSWGAAMEFPNLDALVSRSGTTPRAQKHIAGVKYESITTSEKR